MPARLSEWLLRIVTAVGLIFGAALPAAAALQGQVRFAAAHDEPVWVGQEVELYLELWSDGLSFGDQQFVLPEVTGGYLLQGDASTIKLSETRQGTTWQGLRYTFLLYPQAAGRLRVPAFEVRFSARADFGSEPTAFRFQTRPVEVEARLPPGAQPGELLVTTPDFGMEARWDRPLPSEGPLRLVTGDALTLEVRRRAADVPGMVFSPLAVPEFDGLGVYATTPRVEDRVNRGELSGQRVDRITFVCEQAGRYEIPPWRFQWWDPERQVLSEKVIAALPLEVSVNPAYRSISDAGAERAGGRWLAVILPAALGVLALAAFWRRYGRAVLMRLQGRRQGRQQAAIGPPRRDGRLQPLNPRTAGRVED